MTRKQQILTGRGPEDLVEPLHVFWRCRSRMVTVEGRACEGGCHMRQKLFDRKRLAKETGPV
jgi:hypothetical protein